MSSPYSLRAGLLNQAQDIVYSKYHHENDKIKYLVDRNMVDPKSVKWPEFPTTDDVIVEAEKLYKFVQKK